VAEASSLKLLISSDFHLQVSTVTAHYLHPSGTHEHEDDAGRTRQIS